MNDCINIRMALLLQRAVPFLNRLGPLMDPADGSGDYRDLVALRADIAQAIERCIAINEREA